MYLFAGSLALFGTLSTPVTKYMVPTDVVKRLPVSAKTSSMPEYSGIGRSNTDHTTVPRSTVRRLSTQELLDVYDEPTRTHYLFDIGFMLSNWQCIFGKGCKGIGEDFPDVGCCHYGINFDDGGPDHRRIRSLLPRLMNEPWFAENAKHITKRESSWVKREHGMLNTATYDGACVFHVGAQGCAFHMLALQEGGDPYDYKPSGCNTAPVVAQPQARRPDGTDVFLVHPWDHYSWTDDNTRAIDYVCAEDERTYTADKRVYQTYRREIISLSNERVYNMLAHQCEKRMDINVHRFAYIGNGRFERAAG